MSVYVMAVCMQCVYVCETAVSVIGLIVHNGDVCDGWVCVHNGFVCYGYMCLISECVPWVFTHDGCFCGGCFEHV